MSEGLDFDGEEGLTECPECGSDFLEMDEKWSPKVELVDTAVRKVVCHDCGSVFKEYLKVKGWKKIENRP